MRRDQLVSLGIALCCLFALGTAGATLDTSVSTSPDEVTTLDDDRFPVGTQVTGELRRTFENTDEPQTGEESRQPAGQPDDGSEESQRSPDTDTDRQTPSSGGADQSDTGGADDSSAEGGDSGFGDDSSTTELSLWEQLLALLRELLALLLSALPAVLAVAALAAAFLFRDRLFDALSSDGPVGATDGTARSDERPVGAPDPEHDVARAWVRLCEAFGLADRADLTPAEVEREAVERGADREPVEDLTRLFTEVQYGGARPTDERARRARDRLEQLGLAPGSDRVRTGGSR